MLITFCNVGTRERHVSGRRQNVACAPPGIWKLYIHMIWWSVDVIFARRLMLKEFFGRHFAIKRKATKLKLYNRFRNRHIYDCHKLNAKRLINIDSLLKYDHFYRAGSLAKEQSTWQLWIRFTKYLDDFWRRASWVRTTWWKLGYNHLGYRTHTCFLYISSEVSVHLYHKGASERKNY